MVVERRVVQRQPQEMELIKAMRPLLKENLDDSFVVSPFGRFSKTLGKTTWFLFIWGPSFCGKLKSGFRSISVSLANSFAKSVACVN